MMDAKQLRQLEHELFQQACKLVASMSDLRGAELADAAEANKALIAKLELLNLILTTP